MQHALVNGMRGMAEVVEVESITGSGNSRPGAIRVHVWNTRR
jgi:hypothetical protein